MSYEIDGVRLVDDVGNVYDIEEWLDLHGYVELPRDANGITDELRKWAEEFWEFSYSKFGDQRNLIAIADRIDAAHKKALSEQPCTIDMVPMTDERMAEHGWVRLPVDASGMPIFVGNEVETIQGKRDEVCFMTINGAGWLINEAGWLPTHLRHYAIDTWESIISDAVKLGFTDPDNEHLADKLVSRCKALAGDDK